jgi:hypothetical protein
MKTDKTLRAHQVRRKDGGFGRRQDGIKNPKGTREARPSHCAGVPDDLSDSGGGTRKRTRTVG